MHEESRHRIGLLFSSLLDQKLIARFLEESGYSTHVSSFSKERMEEWSRLSLIIADEEAARMVGKLLLELKRQSGASLLPILVALRQGSDSLPWFRAGFDDVLRLPLAQAELLTRLKVFLRLREHSTEQHRVDQALLEEVLRQMPAAVIIAEARTGRIVLGNKQVEEIWGHPVLGSMSVGEYAAWRGFHADGRALAADEWPLARSLKRGEAVTNEEIEIERADGERRTILVSSAPIYNRDGQVIAGVVTFYDITERKQSDREREELLEKEHRARRAAEEANRAKDDFLSILSHELRTPLTPILGWVSMLRGGQLQQSPDSLDLALQTIERNARQELAIVDEMLDLSRILNNKIVLEPELINPADALAASFAFARPLVKERDLRLESSIEPNLPFIYADPKRLQQILSNLISNAVKFTDDGGRITLGLKRVPDGVEFFVNDTGVGIRAEALPRIFDRFSQADTSTTRRFGGLGIGLSVVRGLAELHGGRVRAESEGEGLGSTFSVFFPAALTAPHLRSQSDYEEPASRRPDALTERRRVLVVDDSPDALTVMKLMIETGGYEVETAASVTAALAAARRSRPDLIVSDLGMPDEDGFKLLSLVRSDEELSAIPVIAVTGFASSSDKGQTLAAGFSAHLAKPVEPATLVRTIDEILSHNEK